MPDVEVVITPTPDVVVEVTEEGSPPVNVTLTPPPEVVEVQVPGPAGPPGEPGPQGEPGEGGGASTWDELTGKPLTFPPSTHAPTHKGDGSDPIANATTSVAGLESAADKTKLDGIETGATADQTASEILTALKTVDGSGSLLDADLLDGNDSSAFAGVSHASTHKGDGSDPIANATTSVAGLESAADKTKLDGIESGATADQTAAEILTAIKTVDGSGSGLDADLIDGHDTSYFATASHAAQHKGDGSDPIADATTSVAGLESAADKTKLDGIEPGATADQTASEMLTAIKTVDGTGSGLDADLLDGHDTGYFATAAHAAQHKGDGSDPIANATQTVAGLESAADKTKLDGIETGATADQTAAEILTAVKTVDGSGSGLDADLLDGNNSSAFAASSHATSHVTGGSDVIANAVASGNAGLLSGTDKSKLDGIESGATQDQTASEILTAIKTVDGAGSGLDADLLDGHDTGYFATATGLSDHLADTSDAHDASAISVVDAGGYFTSSEVEGVTQELGANKSTGLLNTVEVDLGSTPRRSGHFDITTTGLTAGQNVIVEQINGPYTSKGTLADEAEMDQFTVTGQAISSTVIRCYWTSPTVVKGNFKFAYTLVSTLNTVPEATDSTPGLVLADMLSIRPTEVSVTGAMTLTSTAFGKMHVCSGTSADYTVGLPAVSGNAGKVIGFRMADALTKLVTLDANASETIDGATTRVMWAQESAVLLCDGAGWIKIAGRFRPMIAAMRETANQSIPASTTTTLTMSVADKDIGGIADLVNERINIRRAGTYFVVGSMALAAGATATRIITSLLAGSLSTNAEMACPNASMMPGPMCTTVADLAAGDACVLSVWHDTSLSRNTGASVGSGTQPRLSAIEQVTW